MWFSRKLSYIGSLGFLYAAISTPIAGCRGEQGQETPKQDIQIYCTIDNLTRRVDNLENERKEKECITHKKFEEKKQSPESLERQLDDANVTIAELEREKKRLKADYARVWGYLYDKQEDKFLDETIDKMKADEEFRNRLYEKIKPGPVKN